MDLRYGVKIHIAEYPREAEEILVLDPAGCRPFEDLDRQLVLACGQVRGQVEFGRGEAIGAVANVVAIQPQG